MNQYYSLKKQIYMKRNKSVFKKLSDTPPVHTCQWLDGRRSCSLLVKVMAFEICPSRSPEGPVSNRPQCLLLLQSIAWPAISTSSYSDIKLGINGKIN